MVAQPYPFTPSQHAELLHPLARHGGVVLARTLPEHPYWAEESWWPFEFDMVLHDLAGKQDRYLTQNRFTGRQRVIAQLKEITAMWVDLDFYAVPKLAGCTPEAVFELVLEHLESAGIPEPSLVLCSGQGLYVVWLLYKPVGRKHLPRWNDAQRRLCALLKPLGADPAAKDAARVLRIVGTTNSKNGSLVYSLREPQPRRPFEELADSILQGQDDEGEQTADLHDLTVQRVARREYKAPRRFTEATLWEARLTDLQTLRRLRYGQGQMEDFRDRWLFIAGNAMAWLTDSPEVLQRELVALAEEAGGWGVARSKSKLGAIFERVHMAARGETVTFKGVEWDPRYHFHNETLMQWLEIAPEEERQMVTIIGQEEGRRRDREYRRKKRRADGVQPRAQYEQKRTAALLKNSVAARQLRECGLSAKEIASKMGVSERTVQRWFQK